MVRKAVAMLSPVDEPEASASLKGSVLEEFDLIAPLHEVWGQKR